MNTQLQKAPNQYPTTLYRLVYSSRPVFVMVAVLIGSFLLQPIARVEAEEVVGVPAPDDVPLPVDELTTTTDIPLPPSSTELAPAVVSNEDEFTIGTDEVSEISPPAVADSLLVSEADNNESATGTPASLASVADQLPSSETSTTDNVVEFLDVTDGDSGAASTVPPTGEVATTSALTSDEPDRVLGAVEVEESAIGPEAVDLSSIESVSSTTTTTTTAEAALPLVHESYSDAEVRFLKRDCVAVDGGAFYCQVRSPQGSAKDALIAEPDSGGDLEIFLVKDGEYIQLTFNDDDDAAPYYDGRSQTMVWHRLLGDAYVIYEYDFETGEEQALTRGLVNDMEPSRFGDRTVWQRWVDGRWQIVLQDDGEEIQLTTADAHHVAPVIRGEMVMWQTIDAEGTKQIEMLDLLTGTYQSINDSESAALANPRMMMVYEAVYENGDVVTRGVDLKTGQIVSLDALPTELPDEIPSTDSTGETRALIQAKPTQKEGDVEQESEPTPSVPPAASTTDSLTLDLSTGELASSASTTASSSLVLGNTDLVIEPLVATATASSTE